MGSIRTYHIVIGTIILVVGVVLCGAVFRGNLVNPPLGDKGSGASEAALNASRSSEELMFLKCEPYSFPAEFNAIDTKKRVEEIKKLPMPEQADLINSGKLTFRDKPFLLNIVTDKSFEATVRNEAAYILRSSEFQDPDQWKLYAPMVEDETENIINRNYAIQYMAGTYSFASDPAAIEQKLYEYSRMKDDSLGATALLQVFHLFTNGDIKELRSGFADAAAKLADNLSASVDDRLTAICILSETAQKEHLPLLRKYALQNESSSLKRTAIAALGERGEKQDLGIIEENSNNNNLAVKLAATEALKKYRERFVLGEAVSKSASGGAK